MNGIDMIWGLGKGIFGEGNFLWAVEGILLRVGEGEGGGVIPQI